MVPTSFFNMNRGSLILKTHRFHARCTFSLMDAVCLVKVTFNRDAVDQAASHCGTRNGAPSDPNTCLKRDHAAAEH